MKNLSCSFSGHRKLQNDFNEEKLRYAIIEMIKKGYQYFYVGMALGFDSKCFKILEELRNNYSLKIIACIPCNEQADNFSLLQKQEYYRMLKTADEQYLVSSSYHKGCMQLRNKYMVDNSSALICYLRESKGGTFNTVNYAKKNNLEIIYI